MLAVGPAPVPSSEAEQTAHRSAAEWRLRLHLGTHEPIRDLRHLLNRLVPNVTVRFEHLSAPSGRQDALLCPRAQGGFTIVVDPRPSPRDPPNERSANDMAEPHFLRWRIAHELGHTFFYDDDQPARRRISWNPAEEEWADLFATYFLTPSQLCGYAPAMSTT